MCKKASENTQLILSAAQLAAYRTGDSEMKKVLKTIVNDPENSAKKFHSKEVIIRPFTKEEALAFFINHRLSKEQYKSIRLELKEHGAELLPSYEKVFEAKKSAVPEGISISKSEASVPFQNLLDHSASRIIKVKESEIVRKMKEENVSVIHARLVVNAGCDGTSNQQVYCYAPRENESNFNSGSIFASTMTPLTLTTSSGDCLWQNETPHSVRFCRPIKLTFAKKRKI